MKKLLLNILVFAILAIVIFALMNSRLKHTVHPNDYYFLKYREISNLATNADNIIIGTSHAVHGIQPEILDKMGISFYNFAYNGANTEFYLLWYENIFRPYYKKPKYIIISIDMDYFNDKWLWRNYEQDSEYFPENVFLRNLIEENGLKKSMLMYNRCPVIKYRKSLKNYFHHDSYPVIMAKFKDGFVPYEIKNAKITEFPRGELSLNAVQHSGFERFIRLLFDDGIKIIFIDIPTYNPDFQPDTNSEIYAYYKALSKKYSIPFINYNADRRSSLNSNKIYYSDGGHLNNMGSYEFSNRLIEDLKKIMTTSTGDQGQSLSAAQNRDNTEVEVLPER